MNSFIQTVTSPLGLIVLMAVLGTTLVLFVLVGSGRQTADPLSKLRDQARAEATGERSRLSRRQDPNEIQKQLDRFKSFLEPSSKKEMDAARLELLQAGYHGRNAVRDFHAAKFILGISGLLVGLVYTLVTSGDGPVSPVMMAVPVLVPTLIGYYLPVYWVKQRRDERQDQIIRGFPDALDMLLICTEAGQSLDQSIARVARELRTGYPALAEEFETIALETKAGKDRLEVLKDMGERSGNADIRSFASVLIQSTTTGTSVSDALRVYASEMRDKRIMLAEEKANVLPTKLTMGTMLFTVPPLLIILIGPSVYGVMTMLNTVDFGL